LIQSDRRSPARAAWRKKSLFLMHAEHPLARGIALLVVAKVECLADWEVAVAQLDEIACIVVVSWWEEWPALWASQWIALTVCSVPIDSVASGTVLADFDASGFKIDSLWGGDLMGHQFFIDNQLSIVIFAKGNNIQ
jgi:hypothetical protein